MKEDVGKSSVASCSLREPGQLGVRATGEGADAQSSTAAQEDQAEVVMPKKRRTRSEAAKEHWRLIRAGLRPHPNTVVTPSRKTKGPARNPLFDLKESIRSELFARLRECVSDDVIRAWMRREKLPEVTSKQLDNFFDVEADNQWRKRCGRATAEANALVRLAEDSVPKFSAGILAALGQEAFRQVVRGEVDPATVGRWATLFMKARSDERTDQMQELRREKLRHELEEQVEHALEKLAEEVERHPAAREAFEALRRELIEHREDNG